MSTQTLTMKLTNLKIDISSENMDTIGLQIANAVPDGFIRLTTKFWLRDYSLNPRMNPLTLNAVVLYQTLLLRTDFIADYPKSELMNRCSIKRLDNAINNGLRSRMAPLLDDLTALFD